MSAAEQKLRAQLHAATTASEAKDNAINALEQARNRAEIERDEAQKVPTSMQRHCPFAGNQVTPCRRPECEETREQRALARILDGLALIRAATGELADLFAGERLVNMAIPPGNGAANVLGADAELDAIEGTKQ
jgi:hypothetical protein